MTSNLVVSGGILSSSNRDISSKIFCRLQFIKIEMNDTQALERVEMMRNAILKESEAHANEILEEAQNVGNEKKSQLLGRLREGLRAEFKKREYQRKVELETERSRRINRSRIDVQEKRNGLLEELREELKGKLVEFIKDKAKYQEILTKLIVQV